MPEPDAPRSGSRPPSRDKPRSPYYRASLVLAFVFLVLALSLPLWLDRVRQRVDRGVLDRDLTSVPATPIPVPIPLPAASPASPAGQARGAAAPAAVPPATNVNCRAYVYARCNALRIQPSDCLPIALDAMRVPAETGLSACREAVEGRLTDAAKAAGTGAEEASPAPAEPVPVPGVPKAPGAPSTAGSPGASSKPPEGPAGEGGAQDSKPRLPPAEQAAKLAKVLQVLDELQRGANNYATVPAAQDARMAEIRALVEEVGTEDARKMYNQLRERYVAPPPQDANAPVREAQRVETGASAYSAPATTPELDRVRSMMNDARKQAGLPVVPAPDPNDALRSRTPGEAAASSAVEQRP